MERSPDDDAARVYAYTLLLPHQGPLTAPQPQDSPIQPRATQSVEILCDSGCRCKREEMVTHCGEGTGHLPLALGHPSGCPLGPQLGCVAELQRRGPLRISGGSPTPLQKFYTDRHN
jgi:hypothetical protein